MSPNLFGDVLPTNPSEKVDHDAARKEVITIVNESEFKFMCRTCGEEAIVTPSSYLICPAHTALIDPRDIGHEIEKGIRICR